jgi:single-strand DNA-binding protein
MASKSLNRVSLLGNLAREAETVFTPSGVAATNFTLVTNRRWKDRDSGEWKEEAEFHRCRAWRMENIGQYLTKGKQVLVEGRLQTRSYEKDNVKHFSTEIIVEELFLLGGGGERREDAPASQPSAGGGVLDDDVPF